MRESDVLRRIFYNELSGAVDAETVVAGVEETVAGALTRILSRIRTFIQSSSRPLRQIELQSGPEIKHFQQATKDWGEEDVLAKFVNLEIRNSLKSLHCRDFAVFVATRSKHKSKFEQKSGKVSLLYQPHCDNYSINSVNLSPGLQHNS